jgi:hypothetical protein
MHPEKSAGIHAKIQDNAIQAARNAHTSMVLLFFAVINENPHP